MGFPVTLDPELISPTLASQLGGGQPGLLSALSFCHWSSPEHGNKSELVWNTAFKLAQVGIATYNCIKQAEIADKQMDLAEKWYSHANYKWNRFEDAYMPLEKQMVQEVMTTPKPKLNCSLAEHLAESSVNSAYDIMQKFFDNQMRKYGACGNAVLNKNMHIQKNLLEVDSKNYNMQDDRWYRDFKDDQRWGRRVTIANLGRNTSALAKSYGDAANKMLTQVSGHWNTFASSAMQALGYFGARNDTYMPSSFLGTGGQGTRGSIIGIGMGPGTIDPNILGPVAP